MRATLLASASALILVSAGSVAIAQEDETQDSAQAGQSSEETRQSDAGDGDTVVVTATRREQSIQDVPLSITAFQQEELSQKGVVGYEGLASETPGVVINKPTQNFNNFTARGLATNGYGANLQSTVAIYIDEVPISANGNSTIIDPNLYDVERVEFLRGPQGTLFGSGSLAGAVRIITKEPDLDEFDYSALVDFGATDGDNIRQRYNGMVNIPIVNDKSALRVVGFYRNEEGWVDNLGTGIENSNDLEDWGGRAIWLTDLTDRLSVKLMASYEESNPADSALTNPDRGIYKRLSDEPDQFAGELTNYNATITYDFDWADLTSSSTWTTYDQLFYVDLAGTFGQLIPFALDADAYDDIFVEEVRLVSNGGGRWDWVLGGFYFDKTRTVDYGYRSNEAFLSYWNSPDLIEDYYSRYTSYFESEEIAAFGELTYRFSDEFWLTGGLRYGSTEVQGFTKEGGYTSNYLTVAFTGAPLVVTPLPAAEGVPAREEGPSYKLSASYKPVESTTFYATYATGFRTPSRNARAGAEPPAGVDDIIIPEGAESDDLKSYEVGMKGRWADGKVHANLAAYYIDWSNIQVQANRVSDTLQFATNIGQAISKGVEWEVGLYPVEDFFFGFNGAWNNAEVTELTESEAAISGAEEGIQLSAPEWTFNATSRYNFVLPDDTEGWIAGTVSYVDEFPNMFPNVPGQPTVQAPTYDYTDAWTNVNAQVGIQRDDWKVIGYVENLFDDESITYVHPEAFIDGRYGRLRPRTIGIRVSYGI